MHPKDWTRQQAEAWVAAYAVPAIELRAGWRDTIRLHTRRYLRRSVRIIRALLAPWWAEPLAAVFGAVLVAVLGR